MFKLQSVTGRIAVGKLVGLVMGIVAMIALPSFGFPMFSMFGLGTLIMFMLMGVLVAFMGQYDRHPLFDFKMHWWMRGAVVGFVVMLMYILLSYASLETVMMSNIISWMGLTSPFWALLDGMVIGMIMAFAETKIAGAGPDLPLK